MKGTILNFEKGLKVQKGGGGGLMHFDCAF